MLLLEELLLLPLEVLVVLLLLVLLLLPLEVLVVLLLEVLLLEVLLLEVLLLELVPPVPVAELLAPPLPGPPALLLLVAPPTPEEVLPVVDAEEVAAAPLLAGSLPHPGVTLPAAARPRRRLTANGEPWVVFMSLSLRRSRGWRRRAQGDGAGSPSWPRRGITGAGRRSHGSVLFVPTWRRRQDAWNRASSRRNTAARTRSRRSFS